MVREKQWKMSIFLCYPPKFKPAPDSTMSSTASSLDQYEVLDLIGKGSFGVVSRIRRKSDGRILVWKEMNYGTMREKEKQLVVSEVRRSVAVVARFDCDGKRRAAARRKGQERASSSASASPPPFSLARR